MMAVILVIVALACFGATYYFWEVEPVKWMSILFALAGLDMIFTVCGKPLFKGGPLAKAAYGDIAKDGII